MKLFIGLMIFVMSCVSITWMNDAGIGHRQSEVQMENPDHDHDAVTTFFEINDDVDHSMALIVQVNETGTIHDNVDIVDKMDPFVVDERIGNDPFNYIPDI